MAVNPFAGLSQSDLDALRQFQAAGMTEADVRALHQSTQQPTLSFGAPQPTLSFGGPMLTPLSPQPIAQPLAQPANPFAGLSQSDLNALQELKNAGLSQSDVIALSQQSPDYTKAAQTTSALNTHYQSPDWQGLSNAQKMTEINSWWDDIHMLSIRDPSGFQRWEQENPVDAVRFHARAANKNVGQRTGLTNKEHQQRANQIGASIGKNVATDFSGKVFKDVTNAWGPGDFMKIGTQQTQADSMFLDILNHPVTQILGNVALPGVYQAAFPAFTLAANAVDQGEITTDQFAQFVGSAAPGIGAGLGQLTGGAIKPLYGTAMAAGASTALAGGDWDEAVTSGLTNLVVNVGTNILTDAIVNPDSEAWTVLNDILPEEQAKELGGWIDDNITTHIKSGLESFVPKPEQWILDTGEVIDSPNLSEIAADGSFTVDGVTYNRGNVVDYIPAEAAGSSFINEGVDAFLSNKAGQAIGSYINWRFTKGGGPSEGQQGGVPTGPVGFPGGPTQGIQEPEVIDPNISTIPETSIQPEVPGEVPDQVPGPEMPETPWVPPEMPDEIPEVPGEYAEVDDIPEIPVPPPPEGTPEVPDEIPPPPEIPEQPETPETPEVPEIPEVSSDLSFSLFGGGGGGGDLLPMMQLIPSVPATLPPQPDYVAALLSNMVRDGMLSGRMADAMLAEFFARNR